MSTREATLRPTRKHWRRSLAISSGSARRMPCRFLCQARPVGQRCKRFFTTPKRLSRSSFFGEQGARIENVIAHRAAGGFRIAGADRGVDFAVELERLFDRDTFGELVHAGEHGAVNSLEEQLADAVSTGPENGVVKSHVRLKAIARGFAALQS